jgi:pimeloyl-ACP methyl ester carboxylesterase
MNRNEIIDLGHCPCNDETPESIKIRANTDTLIITVHGTNAKHAKWTYSGNFVDSLLQENPATQISRFCWSGGNSHAKRLKAGNELADYIRKLSKNYPEIKFILIGHSHGGNVIMYALNKLRESNDENRIKKVVTLATPYLYMKLRKLNPLIIYSSFFVTLFCLIELKLGDWKIHTNYLAILMIVIFTLWQLLVLISIFSQRNRWKRFWQYVLILIGKDRDLSILENEIADFELRQTKSGTVHQHKHLIIRPVGDEATMALTVSQFLSWANTFLLKLFSNICDNNITHVFRPTKEYFIRFGNFYGLSHSYKSESTNEDFYIAIIRFSVTAPIIVLLCQVIFPNISLFIENGSGGEWFLILIISPLVLAGAILCFLGIISTLSLFFLTISALPFGLDAVFWSLFTQTTVESTPPGLYDVYVHPSDNDKRVDKELDLAHSLIYNDNEIIIRIKGWLLKNG